MELMFFTANCTGKTYNCDYPNKVCVNSAEKMKEVIPYDHVCAKYYNNYRSVLNFHLSNVVVMDCDNDHSDNPDNWISADNMKDMLPDTPYVIVPSRHDMKDKDGKSARPRWHIYFEINPITNADTYAQLKADIFRTFPFFDGNALDSARFIFGTKVSQVYWNEGSSKIDELVTKRSKIIPQGQRNSTLSRFAGRVIKRYGITEKAYNVFLQEANKCEQPLDDSEINKIWSSAVKFGKRIQSENGYISPEEYNTDFKAEDLKPSDFSDIGQAKALSKEYGNELVYTDSTDFMRYNGMNWVESRQLAVGACEEFLDLQLADADDKVQSTKQILIDSGISEDLITTGGKALEKIIDVSDMDKYREFKAALAYKAFVMKRRDMKYITSALQAAKPMLLHDIKDFDSQEFLLNTPSATYDLSKGVAEYAAHDANNYITKITSVSPDLRNMDIWLSTLDSLFCGDTELIEYVQMVCGLASIGKVYQEALIIAYGEGGNGKSTFWNTIAGILGSYSGTISADALTIGCKRNVKPEMAELKGKRLVIASELEEGMRLNTSIVKQLCSTDEVSAEKKYKDPFKYSPTHTLVLYTNHLPKVGANDDGTWRRLIVIPFNAKIAKTNDIKNYTDYLINNAGGAVLTWIIEGAKKVIDRGFKPKKAKLVEDAINKYRANNDWLALFIDECCEVGPSYKQKSGELYQEYRNYCTRMGEYTRSTTDFYAGLEIIGCEKKRISNGSIIKGIRLKPMFLDD